MLNRAEEWSGAQPTTSRIVLLHPPHILPLLRGSGILRQTRLVLHQQYSLPYKDHATAQASQIVQEQLVVRPATVEDTAEYGSQGTRGGRRRVVFTLYPQKRMWKNTGDVNALGATATLRPRHGRLLSVPSPDDCNDKDLHDVEVSGRTVAPLVDKTARSLQTGPRGDARSQKATRR